MRLASLLLLSPFCLLLGASSPLPARAAPPEAAATAAGSPRDFDFFLGTWKVHNRRLKRWLQGSQEWEEFEATCRCVSVLGGAANQDEFRTPARPGFVGMSLRLFEPATGKWRIYWLDNRTGVLQPPVVGGFSGDAATFEGDDVLEGRPVRVRYLWTRVRSGRPRWEQAISADGGRSWETNWVMDFTPAGEEGAR